jgi:hypothetical protein
LLPPPSSVLPISRGGTSVSSFEAGKVIATDENASPNVSKSIDTVATSGSANLLTSGGAYSYLPAFQNLSNSLITLGTSFTKVTDAEPVIKKFGNIISISGPVKVATAIGATTIAPLFTINASYIPENWTSIACSADFISTPIVAHPYCGYNAGARLKTDVALPIGTIIDLNYIYWKIV